jgi:hypothetical protein
MPRKKGYGETVLAQVRAKKKKKVQQARARRLLRKAAAEEQKEIAAENMRSMSAVLETDATDIGAVFMDKRVGIRATIDALKQEQEHCLELESDVRALLRTVELLVAKRRKAGEWRP